MFPVLALVGRPNVGKSTLFNRLTSSMDALIDDQPGATRDRLYGTGRIGSKSYLVVDTGGIASEHSNFSTLIKQQVSQVIEEAQSILFLVDSKEGLIHQDKGIADQLRKSGRKIFLVVNKSEGIEPELATAEFQELAVGTPIAISAKRGDGVESLVELILENYEYEAEQELYDIRKIALVGRPNVGKSTLTNKLVGEHRVIVSDHPGATRDSIRIPITVKDQNYVLIDTAGVRRRLTSDQAIEKFSVVKTLQAIKEANVVILILDASSEIGGQDAMIAGIVHNLGRSMVVVINKWDRLKGRQKTKIKRELEKKLVFLPNTEFLFISALYGYNIVDVIPAVQRAYQSAMISISTSSLNRTLEDAVAHTQPPMYHQRPVKLKFTHQAGKNPPVIVVYGNQAESIPESYRKYLSNFFVRAYRLVGTPVRIIPRSSKNPFKKDRGGKKSSKLSLRIRRGKPVRDK